MPLPKNRIMISRETVKREGKIIFFCFLILAFFILAIGFYNEHYKTKAAQEKSAIDKAQAVSDSLVRVISSKKSIRDDFNSKVVNFLYRKCNLKKASAYDYITYYGRYFNSRPSTEQKEKQRKEQETKCRWIDYVDFCDTTLYALNNTNLHLGYDFIANYETDFGKQYDLPSILHFKAFLNTLERETNTTREQVRKNSLDNDIKQLSNDFISHSKNILTREERNEIESRFFWALLLVVYTSRGIKVFMANKISQKKKVIAFLSVWSFVHFTLFIFGYNRWTGDESKYFFPITDDFWNNGHFEVEYYDMTELIVYVGGAWLIFFLYYYLNEDKMGKY